MYSIFEGEFQRRRYIQYLKENFPTLIGRNIKLMFLPIRVGKFSFIILIQYYDRRPPPATPSPYRLSRTSPPTWREPPPMAMHQGGGAPAPRSICSPSPLLFSPSPHQDPSLCAPHPLRNEVAVAQMLELMRSTPEQRSAQYLQAYCEDLEVRWVEFVLKGEDNSSMVSMYRATLDVALY